MRLQQLLQKIRAARSVVVLLCIVLLKISWGPSAALGVSSADVQSLLTGLLQRHFSCALEERPPRSEPANPASPLAEGKEECLAMSLGTAFTDIFHVHALELALSACCQKARIWVCRGAE